MFWLLNLFLKQFYYIFLSDSSLRPQRRIFVERDGRQIHRDHWTRTTRSRTFGHQHDDRLHTRCRHHRSDGKTNHFQRQRVVWNRRSRFYVSIERKQVRHGRGWQSFFSWILNKNIPKNSFVNRNSCKARRGKFVTWKCVKTRKYYFLFQ